MPRSTFAMEPLANVSNLTPLSSTFFLGGFYIENRLIKDTFYFKNKSDLVLIPVLILGLSSNNGCIKLEYCDLAIFDPFVI